MFFRRPVVSACRNSAYEVVCASMSGGGWITSANLPKYFRSAIDCFPGIAALCTAVCQPVSTGSRSVPRPPHEFKCPTTPLLQLDFGAGRFELLLDLFCFLLRRAFLDRLRSAFDEVLRF